MANNQDGIGETHTNLAVRLTTVAGAAAGNVLVPAGWEPGSSLKAVVTLTGVDRTLDFTESDDGAGIVGGGATTAGATLLVLFIAAHPKGGSLTRGG